METSKIVQNLRAAIAASADYHVERWGREACDRLEEQERVIKAFREREVETRNTEPEKERVCKTCRWFEDERWVSTYGNVEEFKHARCHKGPGSSYAYADDWCSEWEEA